MALYQKNNTAGKIFTSNINLYLMGPQVEGKTRQVTAVGLHIRLQSMSLRRVRTRLWTSASSCWWCLGDTVGGDVMTSSDVSDGDEYVTHFKTTSNQQYKGPRCKVSPKDAHFPQICYCSIENLHRSTTSYITTSPNGPWSSRTTHCWFTLSEDTKNVNRNDEWKCPTKAEENGRGCVMVMQLCGTRAHVFVLAVGLMQNPNY